MLRATCRVPRSLIIALAVLMGTGAARAQTIVLSPTLSRDRPLRPSGQKPNWVSRADCLEDDNLYFEVTLGNFAGLTLQVWASNQGVDCLPPNERQSGGAAECWKVYDAPATRESTTVKIKATDLVARLLPDVTPPSSDVRDICTDTSAPRGQPLSLLFMYVSSGTTIVGTPQLFKGVGYDVMAPEPPTGVTAKPGEKQIDVSFAPSQDGDAASYRFYCDPALGTVPPDGGGNAASCSATSTVLLPGTDPTYPDSLEDHVCGSTSGLTMTTSGTIEGLVDKVPYVVSLAAVDQVGNVGVLSPAACATPSDAPGPPGVGPSASIIKCGEDGCSLSRVRGRTSTSLVAGLLAVAGAVRRARRARRERLGGKVRSGG